VEAEGAEVFHDTEKKQVIEFGIPSIRWLPGILGMLSRFVTVNGHSPANHSAKYSPSGRGAISERHKIDDKLYRN
jgi:hypothetical protein